MANPLVFLAAMALIAGALCGLCRRAGRPTGIEEVERFAEAEV